MTRNALADPIAQCDPSAPLAARAAILVVDLEATCSDTDPAFDMETIEIGACWVGVDGLVLDRFQSFVRPVVNPQLTAFCTSLIGIRQADIDSAPLFPDAAAALRDFVSQHQQPGSVWASWGAYDARQIDIDCARHGVENPLADWGHINLKKEFARVQKIKRVGMKMALSIVGLPLEGKHHSGIDDARNIARLMPFCFTPS